MKQIYFTLVQYFVNKINQNYHNHSHISDLDMDITRLSTNVLHTSVAATIVSDMDTMRQDPKVASGNDDFTAKVAKRIEDHHYDQAFKRATLKGKMRECDECDDEFELVFPITMEFEDNQGDIIIITVQSEVMLEEITGQYCEN